MSTLAKAAVASPRLGDLLLRYNLITQHQLDAALQQQKTTKKRLGAILIDQGIVTEDAVNYVLSEQLHLPYIQITPEMVDPAVISLIPQEVLKKYLAVPLLQLNNELTIAMVDPTDQEAINEFIAITGCRMLPAIGSSHAIKKVIDEVFSKPILRRSKPVPEPLEFEKLEVYQSALDLADQILKLTYKFPNELQQSLGDSLRDSALSLLTNIAQNEIEDAINNLKKCIPLLMLSTKNQLIDEMIHANLRMKCLQICTQLGKNVLTTNYANLHENY